MTSPADENDLPASWTTITVAEACDNTSVKEKVQQRNYLQAGALPIIDQGVGLIGGYTNDVSKCVTRDLPVIVFGDHTRALKFIDFPFAAGADGIKVLRPKPLFDPKLLFRALQSLRLPEKGYARHFQYLRKATVALPPLSEQIRLRDKIDATFNKLEVCKRRLEAVPLLLRRFREAVLEAAVSGRLTEEWRCSRTQGCAAGDLLREREKERTGRLRIQQSSAAVDRVDLPELPVGWSWVENHRLATDHESAICAGPFGTIFKAKDFRPAGVPIIFLRHVSAGEYRTGKPGYMDEAVWHKLHQPYSVFGGELLVTKLGDPPGSACIYPENRGIAMVTPDVMKMSVDRGIVEPRYLMHYFNSPTSKRILRELAFGVTRLRIDLALFKRYPVPLPTLDEQREIVRRVDNLFAYADSVERDCSNCEIVLKELSSSVLAAAFRGALVGQNSGKGTQNGLEEIRVGPKTLALSESRTTAAVGRGGGRQKKSEEIEMRRREKA